MVTKRVRIQELTSPTLTRRRGRMAFETLLGYLEEGSVEIDFSAHEGPLSLSFLDELALRLREQNLLDRVVFLTPSRRVLERLSQVSTLRGIPLKYRPEPDAPVRPVPRARIPADEPQAVLVPLEQEDEA